MKRKIILAVITVTAIFSASAQYYQMADQLGRMLSPALTGGLNYKGFVDASYLKGVGHKNADFFEITTTQGFRYSDWFFMGVGAGVQIVNSNPRTTFNDWGDNGDYDRFRNSSKTGWIIPLYTDFRFTIGGMKDIAAYIDLRLGASFLVGNDYIRIGDGYMTSSENFYLRPSIGMRIPLGIKNSKQAVNIGITYQLITSNYWYYHSSKTTLSAIGFSIGFEW